MVTTYKHNGLTWIDLESPTSDELNPIIEQYRLHPLVSSELLKPTDRPKIDPHEKYIYLILHFPALANGGSAKSVAHEIDFVLGKDFLITTHYETVESLYEFGKLFEVDALLKRDSLGTHAGFLFFLMIEHLYVSLERQLQSITDDLKRTEKKIFKGEERKMVEVLSNISRRLLDFRIAIKAHKEMWSSFEEAGRSFFGDSFVYHLRALSASYYKLCTMLEGNKEVLLELRETNDSLLSTKTNETMVHLTMMAFVIFPLNLIAAIFAMRTETTPFLGNRYDFWMVIAIMTLAVVGMFSFFKHRKWL